MPKFVLKKEPTALETAIDELISEMTKYPGSSDEYKAMAANVKVLQEALNQERNGNLSPDTKWTIAANLAGIIMILTHERTHVVASKALGFIMKAR